MRILKRGEFLKLKTPVFYHEGSVPSSSMFGPGYGWGPLGIMVKAHTMLVQTHGVHYRMIDYIEGHDRTISEYVDKLARLPYRYGEDYISSTSATDIIRACAAAIGRMPLWRRPWTGAMITTITEKDKTNDK